MCPVAGDFLWSGSRVLSADVYPAAITGRVGMANAVKSVTGLPINISSTVPCSNALGSGIRVGRAPRVVKPIARGILATEEVPLIDLNVSVSPGTEVSVAFRFTTRPCLAACGYKKEGKQRRYG